MSNQILVPALGESVTEATVAKWLKSEGDRVNADEAIVELETDKVNVEVPAPSSGVIDKITIKEGQTVNVGTLLGTRSQSKKAVNNTPVEEKKYTPPPKKPEPIKVVKEKEEVKVFESSEEPLILTNPQEDEVVEQKSKIAAESNININEINGSGKNGVILKEDLLGLMGSKPSPSERKVTHGPEERIKMTRLRMTIAKRLKEAQDNAAMLTTFNEVDMSTI